MAGAAGGRRRRLDRARRVLRAFVLTAVAALLTAPAALAAPDLVWNGSDSVPWWSRADNWNGPAPMASETLGTLSFPQLGAACNEGISGGSCYVSGVNLTGLTVGGLSVDDTVPYELTGRALTLGANGITAAPGAIDSGSSAAIDLPLTLSGGQSWNITGDGATAGLYVDGVSGSSSSLQLTLPAEGQLYLRDPFDVGQITVDGTGSGSSIATIWLGGSAAASDLNGTDGNSVSLTETALVAASGGNAVGPLTANNGSVIEAGIGAAPDGTLAINGSLTLDASSYLSIAMDQPGASSSPTAGTDYSEITATGNVDFGHATLSLFQGLNTAGSCQDFHPGDVYTLVSTSGTLAQDLDYYDTTSNQGVPITNGTTVPITNYCDGSNASASARINYTSNSVTATIVSGGNAGDLPTNTVAPKVTGAARYGHGLTASRGSWTGSPTKFEYQWYRCSTTGCTGIIGATRSTYTLTDSDVGDEIVVDVEAFNSAGFTDAYSGPTGTVAPVGAAVVRRALRSALTVSAKRRHTAAIRQAGGYTTTFNAPSGGKLVIDWRATVGGHRRLIASASSSKADGGRRRVKIRLSAAGRRLLARSAAVKLTATGAFTPTGGRTTTVSRRLTI